MRANKVMLGRIGLEALIGIGLTLVVEYIVDRMKTRRKKDAPHLTPIGDLTVAEFNALLASGQITVKEVK